MSRRPRSERPDRYEQLEKLLAEGHTSHEIAAKLDVTRATVVRQARKRGLDLRADRIVGRQRRVNPERVLRAIADDLWALAPSCEALDLQGIDHAAIVECVEIMGDALHELTRLHQRLQGDQQPTPLGSTPEVARWQHYARCEAERARGEAERYDFAARRLHDYEEIFLRWERGDLSDRDLPGALGLRRRMGRRDQRADPIELVATYQRLTRVGTVKGGLDGWAACRKLADLYGYASPEAARTALRSARKRLPQAVREGRIHQETADYLFAIKLPPNR